MQMSHLLSQFDSGKGPGMKAKLEPVELKTWAPKWLGRQPLICVFVRSWDLMFKVVITPSTSLANTLWSSKLICHEDEGLLASPSMMLSTARLPSL